MSDKPTNTTADGAILDGLRTLIEFVGGDAGDEGWIDRLEQLVAFMRGLTPVGSDEVERLKNGLLACHEELVHGAISYEQRTRMLEAVEDALQVPEEDRGV